MSTRRCFSGDGGVSSSDVVQLQRCNRGRYGHAACTHMCIYRYMGYIYMLCYRAGAPVDQHRTHWVDAALPHLQAADHPPSSRKRLGFDRPTEARYWMYTYIVTERGRLPKRYVRRQSNRNKAMLLGFTYADPRAGVRICLQASADRDGSAVSTSLSRCGPQARQFFTLARDRLWCPRYERSHVYSPPSRWESFGTLREGRAAS